MNDFVLYGQWVVVVISLLGVALGIFTSSISSAERHSARHRFGNVLLCFHVGTDRPPTSAGWSPVGGADRAVDSGRGDCCRQATDCPFAGSPAAVVGPVGRVFCSAAPGRCPLHTRDVHRCGGGGRSDWHGHKPAQSGWGRRKLSIQVRRPH